MAYLSEVQFVKIDTAATATLVAALSTGKIRVVELFLVANAAVTVRFNSGAGGTALTGAMPLAVNGVLVLPHSPSGWFETAAATLLEMALGTAVQVSGALGYVTVNN